MCSIRKDLNAVQTNKNSRIHRLYRWKVTNCCTESLFSISLMSMSYTLPCQIATRLRGVLTATIGERLGVVLALLAAWRQWRWLSGDTELYSYWFNALWQSFNRLWTHCDFACGKRSRWSLFCGRYGVSEESEDIEKWMHRGGSPSLTDTYNSKE